MGHLGKLIEENLWVPLFLLINTVGIVVIPLGLPGLWLQFLTALLASVLTRWLGMAPLPWLCTLMIFGLAAGGEVIDLLLGNRGIRKASGSNTAAWFALIGGFLFGFLGVFVPIPIPIVGSLIGSVIMSFVGTFACAILGEWIHRKRLEARQPLVPRESQLKPVLRVGAGVVMGRVLGIAAKLWFAFVAFGIGCAGALWNMFN